MNKNIQLIIFDTRTEAIENEGLHYEAEEERGNKDFSDFIIKKNHSKKL